MIAFYLMDTDSLKKQLIQQGWMTKLSLSTVDLT